MAADPKLIEQVKQGIWRPHWLTPVGTALALVTSVALLYLLFGARAGLEAWLHDLHSGGLAGTSNTPDRINGIRIVAGFSAMMFVVGATVLLRARQRRMRLFRALAGQPGVVWIYREHGQLKSREEHVLVFGLDSGAKLRVTVPASEADALWALAVAAFPQVSRGHDVQQERRFAVRPALALEQPRVVDGVQSLAGRDRAR